MNSKLNILKEKFFKNGREHDSFLDECGSLFLQVAGFFSIIASCIIGIVFNSGMLGLVSEIGLVSLIIGIIKLIDNSKYESIFKKENKKIYLDKFKKNILKKHIINYFKNRSTENFSFLNYYVNKNTYPYFEEEFIDSILDNEHKIIIENKYQLSNINKINVNMSYEKYDLNINDDLIKWYHEHLNNKDFNINNLLEVKQKLEYLEKNEHLFEKDVFNDEDKELKNILLVIKKYLISVALNYVQSQQSVQSFSKNKNEDKIISISQKDKQKHYVKEIINE